MSKAYQFAQVEEGDNLYRCTVVNLDEVEMARQVARDAVRRALFHGNGNTAWAGGLVHQYPWLGEDAEITRYLRECCR